MKKWQKDWPCHSRGVTWATFAPSVGVAFRITRAGVQGTGGGFQPPQMINAECNGQTGSQLSGTGDNAHCPEVEQTAPPASDHCLVRES